MQNLQEEVKKIYQKMKSKNLITPTLDSKEREKLKKEITFSCEVCEDEGWIYQKNTARPCECYEIKKYREMLEQSGISESFLKIGFSGFETEGKHQSVIQAKESATRYYQNFMQIKETKKNSITFLSKTVGRQKTGIGSGKTHLSIALANNIMNRYKIGVLYMPYRDVITKLKQNMIDEEYYQREVNKYKNASVLLIDDLFKGRVNDADINIMFEIINHRYLNNSPIICSSEFGIDELIEFDQATGSRIIEMSKDYLVEIGLSREELREGKTLNYRLS